MQDQKAEPEQSPKPEPTTEARIAGRVILVAVRRNPVPDQTPEEAPDASA